MKKSYGCGNLKIQLSNESDLQDILNIETEDFGDEGSETAGLVNKLLYDRSARPILDLISFLFAFRFHFPYYFVFNCF
ncbi:hypothetical protein JW835_16705 [bacterium]|nr:hypothetical protein [bacterium]